MSNGDSVLTNTDIIEEFRAHGGRVSGRFDGVPLILLTTRGARSGRASTTPLAAVYEPDRIVVFATNAGADRNPAWLHNVRAHSLVDVESRGGGDEVERFRAHAVVLSPDESARLLEEQSQRNPAYAAYRDGTRRQILAIALRRTDPSDDPAARRRAGEYLLRVHTELRRDLEALRTDLASARRGDGRAPHGVAIELGRRCRAACHALHDHHTGEDAAFETFESQLPHLTPVLDRLRAEHLAVAAALERMESRLDQETVASDGLLDEYDLLLDGVEAHFRYEETALVPVLLDTQADR